MTTDLTVARTILEQLGGGRFVAMTGAYQFLGGPNSLSFRIPKAEQGINRVIITLTPDDLYTVQFWRINSRRGAGVEATLIREAEMIYADGLRVLFEGATGLRTSL